MATVKKAPAQKATPKKKKKKFSAGKALMLAFVAAVVALICALGVYIFIIINGNKILDENMSKLDTAEASHVYDVTEKEVAVLYRENRESVEPKDIPLKLQQAFIATEDRRFDQHVGIDFLGVGRALVKDIIARSAVEGGSTITQQLAKNVFLNKNKTFFRKATEMSIALALEGRFNKDEILTMYLNRIYFDNRAYGIKAAAKKYFNVSDLNKLEVWQMASLAAIPKAPRTYNPLDSPDNNKDRRSVVLKLMEEQGYITADERVKAEAAVYTPPPATGSKDYLAFTDYVISEANDMYGISEDDLLRGGFKIYTTMDAGAQKIIEQTFANDKLFQKSVDEQKMQGAMAIINHKDGGLVAIAGGRDYAARGLNRATLMQQPGSSIKPILVYAPAIESGKYTPYSMLEDNEKNYNGYTPRNYDGVYRGQVTMYEAVKKSINAPAVWLLSQITVKSAMNFGEKLGIPFDKAKDNNLAIALGGMTRGATPVQMAAAYGAFANNGYLNTTHSIIKIVDDKNAAVAAFKEERKSPAMSAKTAYYMTLLMQGVVEPGGTGTAAKFERPLAGKTGSTQNVTKGLEKYNRDLWFTGYTPEWSAAVWIGFDKPDAKHYVTMSSGAPAVIFKEVMQKALAGRPMTQFKRPEGVQDPTAPPKGIGDLSAEYANQTVVLNWSAVGEGTTYQVFRKEDKDADFLKDPLISTVSTSVTDITVKPGLTYQYYVVPLNSDSGAAGAKSNTVTVAAPIDNATDPLKPGEIPGQNPGQVPGQGQTPGQTTPGGTKQGTGTPGTGGTGTPGTCGQPGTAPGGGTTAPGGAGTPPGTGAQPGGTPGGGTTAPGGAGGTGTGTPPPGPPAGTPPQNRTPGTGGTAPITGQSAGGGQTNPGAQPGFGTTTR